MSPGGSRTDGQKEEGKPTEDTGREDAGSVRGESGKGRWSPQGDPALGFISWNSRATSKDSFSRESGLVSFVSLTVGRLGIRLQLCGV